MLQNKFRYQQDSIDQENGEIGIAQSNNGEEQNQYYQSEEEQNQNYEDLMYMFWSIVCFKIDYKINKFQEKQIEAAESLNDN